MHPITIRKRIIETMAKAQLTTIEDMTRIANVGTVALTADRFMELIGRTLGSSAVILLDNFYHEFLGDYPHVAEDTADGNYSLRFFDMANGEIVDGVQLSFVYDGKQRKYNARLYRVSMHNGAVALNLARILEI